MNRVKSALLGTLVGTLAIFDAQATQYTWTGAQNRYSVNSGNWSSTPTFTASDTIYFSQYAGESASRVVEISDAFSIGALVFGSETGLTGNATSVIGSNTFAITVAGASGSSLGLSGSLASTNVGLWLQSGAGANGFYYSNSGTPSSSRSGVAINLTSPSVTFVNDSANPFYLNSRITGTGGLVLQNGSWVINYNSTANATSSSFTGGLTIENASLDLNVGTGVNSDNSYSPLGKGLITLGLSGSDKDATFVFTQLTRPGSNTNRLSATSGNMISVSDGTGARTIRNGNDQKKELYTTITVNGSSTLTLDNSNISGAVFEISATNSGGGVSTQNDLLTGLRGTGNLYLTGGGTFYTKAGLVVPENGVRNSFTGKTTVHQGTLQFQGDGGFQKTSVIQVDKNGVLDVSGTTSGSYTIGSSSYLSGPQTQTLSGTGQVVGTILLGSQSVLRAGGTDSGSYRAALTFTSDLSLGPLTIADIGSSYYGAVDTTGALAYAGELRITLASGFTAGGSYDLFNFASLVAADFSSVTVYSGATSWGSLALGSGGFSSVWLGQVNGQDYAFDQATGQLTVSVVPEPGTMALLGLAGAVLAMKVRKTLRRREGEIAGA
ncbi:PEP-CTERM protein-sorting domain-containing protein [Terrimicrobium sacchariphilum]|uniref:PEP-CTERM protein-sorting domain-containing protein n=1 Tax=Terrimicrobium sacchariphilum TaxID=690879 RepID=A0A146GCM5_TERSA|nr:PEP-CTERM sorting domain-containing protein [Terrimicrobium sacchariphilum]GAT35339.1 PEP-CTERM protein-sorting domain-containing protein [Terrimicrobium sacchariphilum]